VAGAPATQVFKLHARQPGRVNLRFIYKRSWEEEHVKEQRIDLVIEALD
jgi:predicted secreted protein